MEKMKILFLIVLFFNLLSPSLSFLCPKEKCLQSCDDYLTKCCDKTPEQCKGHCTIADSVCRQLCRDDDEHRGKNN